MNAFEAVGKENPKAVLAKQRLDLLENCQLAISVANDRNCLGKQGQEGVKRQL